MRTWGARLALLLALAHLGLAGWDLFCPRPATVYVFTPLVDAWSEGAPLTPEEGERLARDLAGAEARGIQQAYATLGSTLSLAELLEGVAALDAAGVPLSPAQRERLRGVLQAARADHAELVRVQAEILDAEAAVAEATRAVAP